MHCSSRTAARLRAREPRPDRSVITFTSDGREFSGDLLDIHGSTVDEAEPLIDKFIDGAIVSGRRQVRIMHGKGTGALCRGVQRFLGRHPGVARYEFAATREGSYGVTVVTLR